MKLFNLFNHKQELAIDPIKAERKLKVTNKYIRQLESAQYNRLNSQWTAVDFSPAQELYNDLKVLKTRSRDLYCNSPVVNNFVSLLQQNVVGHKGFTLKSKVMNSKNNRLKSHVHSHHVGYFVCFIYHYIYFII